MMNNIPRRDWKAGAYARRGVLLGLFGVTFLSPAKADDQSFTWTGASSSLWMNAGNWTPAEGPPTSASQTAFVGSGSAFLQMGHSVSSPLTVGNGTVANAGSFESDITLESSESLLINSGVISTGNSLSILDSGTLLNSGTINGIVWTNSGYSVNNSAGGLITGSAVAIVSTGWGSITNSGTITSHGSTIDLQGGVVENTNTGVISADPTGGTQGILIANTSGTITNSGTITGNYAVVLLHGGVVTNNAGGALVGSGTLASGISLNDGGDALMISTIHNSGVISGESFGVQFGSNGSVTNTAGGVISSASGIGVLLDWNMTDGALDNFGIISGLNQGVSMEGGGTITNAVGAEITGTNGDGILVTGSNSGTLENGGSIVSTGADGVAFTTSGTVTNGGRVAGLVNGVNMEAGGSVTNTAGGEIAGDSSSGVSIGGGSGSVSNDGLIKGLAHGVELVEGGTVNNNGTVMGVGAAGISVAGAEGIVSNNGLVSSPSAIGIRLAAGGTITNSGTIAGETNGVSLDSGGTVNNIASGRIVGTNSSGVYVLSNTSATVTNGGAIAGSNYGIQLSGGGTVTNLAGGTISGTSGQGIYFGSSGTAGGTSGLTNAGEITASGTAGLGVEMSAGGSIENQSGGVIAGSKSGVVFAGGGSLTNHAGGQISGTNSYAVSGTAGAVTLDNGGVISGNVQLDDSQINTVTLRTGGQIAGHLNVGSNASNQLVLTGAGSQAYSDAVTGATTFSGTLIKNGSGAWAIDKDLSNTAQVTINSGTLQIGAGGAQGSVGGDITTDGLLVFNRSDTLTYGGVISGAGGVQQAGTGTTVLTEASTYSGLTTISQGQLKTENISALGTGTVELKGGSLAISGTLGMNTVIWQSGTIQMALGSTYDSLLTIDDALLNSGAGGSFEFTGSISLEMDYELVKVNGDIINFALSDFSGNSLDGAAPTFSLDRGTISVKFHAVPEPTTVGLAGSGVLLMAFLFRSKWRRRLSPSG